MGKNKVKSSSSRAKKRNSKRKAVLQKRKKAEQMRQEAEKRKKVEVPLKPQVRTSKEEPTESLSKDMQKEILGTPKKGAGAAKSMVSKILSAVTSKPDTTGHRSQNI